MKTQSVVLYPLGIRESLDELENANQKLKNGSHTQNWMHINGLNFFFFFFCASIEIPISFIHLAHTPLHIKAKDTWLTFTAYSVTMNYKPVKNHVYH